MMKTLRLMMITGMAVVIIMIWGLIGATPKPTQAAEAAAACQVNMEGRWLSAGAIPLSRCAGLAGKFAQQGHIKEATARWNNGDVRANSDGTFVQLVNGKTQSKHYWDSDKLVEAVAQDIDGFWRREFDAHGWAYESPTRIQGYAQRIRTGCGLASLNNAFYCQMTHGIYYDTNLLAKQFDRVGDFAPAIVIAHEWGHAIQGLRDIFRRSRYTIETELQADCFAGAYAADADKRGVLEPGDIEEATELLYKIGDPANTPWYARGAHGSAQQRVKAFQVGLKNGAVTCLQAVT